MTMATDDAGNEDSPLIVNDFGTIRDLERTAFVDQPDAIVDDNVCLVEWRGPPQSSKRVMPSCYKKVLRDLDERQREQHGEARHDRRWFLTWAGSSLAGGAAGANWDIG